MSQQTHPRRKTLTSAQHSSREEKLKEAVFKLFLSRHFSFSSSSSCPFSLYRTKIQSFLQTHEIIEDHLPSFYSALRTTPTHPPYAVMVMEAIKELNEKKGSNLEAILSFIETNYEDLPWAHSNLLKHHLSKLVETGEIISSSNSCYLLPNPNSIPSPQNEHEVQHPKSGRRRGRPPKNQVPEGKFVAKTEITGSSGGEDGCLMELGNGGKCESEGNVLVGTESIRSSCDENDGLVDCNECDPEGNFVTKRYVLVGSESLRSFCNEDDGLVDLGNSKENEHEEDFVARTEFVRSSWDEGDDSVFGNGNNLESVIEVKQKQASRSPAKNCDFGPIHQHESEENHPMVRIEAKKCESTRSCDVDNNPTCVVEVEPFQKQLQRTTTTAKNDDPEQVHQQKSEEQRHLTMDASPVVGTEVGSLQQQRQFKPRGTRPEKREAEQIVRSESAQSCADEDDVLMVPGHKKKLTFMVEFHPLKNQLPKTTPAPIGHPEVVNQHKSEENPRTIEIEMEEPIQQLKRRRELFRRCKSTQSCAVGDNPTIVEIEVEPVQKLKHQEELSKRRKFSQSCAAYDNPTVALEIELLEKQLPKATPAKNGVPEQVHQQKTVEQNYRTIGTNPVVGSEEGPLQQQQHKKHVHQHKIVEQAKTRGRPPKQPKRRGRPPMKQPKPRGRPPKKPKAEKVESSDSIRPCDDATEDGFLLLPNQHIKVEIEVAPLQQQQPKRQLRSRLLPVLAIDLPKDGSLQQEKQVKHTEAPKKHKNEQVERRERIRPCADDSTEDRLMFFHDKHIKDGIEVASLHQQQPKCKLQSGCQSVPSTDLVKEGSLQQEKQDNHTEAPKKRETDQVGTSDNVRPCADDATQDGLMLLPDKHINDEIEVATWQQQQPKHRIQLRCPAIPCYRPNKSIIKTYKRTKTSHTKIQQQIFPLGKETLRIVEVYKRRGACARVASNAKDV